MKKFLSDYGFTILAAIVVITLITFGSPIGSTIQKQTTNIVQSLGKVAENDLNKIDDSVSLVDLTNINKSGVVGDFSRKGNLVTINGTQYRVLDVNGTQAKVMSMKDVGNTVYSDGTLAMFDRYKGLQYAGSGLDQAMISYYNEIPADIQKAIVEQNINQSMYQQNSGTNASATFSSFSSAAFNENTVSGADYYLTRITDINVGNRKVYALDIDDVISYLGTNSTPQDIGEMFWNRRSYRAGSSSLGLRSAVFNSDVYTFFVSDYYGSVESYVPYYYGTLVRPAFVIDLSLLS